MGDDKINVRIKTIVQNPDGNHDKTVKLRFDVYNDEKNIGSAELDPVKVEEGDRKTRTALLLLAIRELKSDPVPKLKITVSVWDK